jgi:sugar lactone lactonase YvrE
MPASRVLTATVVTEYTSSLAEGPVWDVARNAICWIDILNGIIQEFSPGQNTYRKIKLDQMIGSLALCEDGNFIAALQNGFTLVDRQTGALKPVVDPEDHLLNNRFNEGKCDPAGRFWAGTMSLSETSGAGSLYVLDATGTWKKKIAGVTISNGMAWSGDQKTFYFIDSPTFEIAAYDYDGLTGAITNRRVIIRTDPKEGFPDGMTIDVDGMLWVAHFNGWQVSRWDPKTGEKLQSIKMPVAKVTCCTFGGDELQDLYITTAKVGLTTDQLRAQPLAGSLFVIKDCGFQGMPAFLFDKDSIT